MSSIKKKQYSYKIISIKSSANYEFQLIFLKCNYLNKVFTIYIVILIVPIPIPLPKNRLVSILNYVNFVYLPLYVF